MSKVLIVDDNAQVLATFQEALSHRDYILRGTTSGNEALDMVRLEAFDLIILDLSMPQPDGFEILKSLRCYSPEAKVIVVSGFLRGALLKAAVLFGAVATLEKPVDPELLASTVADALREEHKRVQ